MFPNRNPHAQTGECSVGPEIFGRRLPEVGRSIGRSIVEFKRGIKGISDDVEDESSRPGVLPDDSARQPLSGVDETAKHEVQMPPKPEVVKPSETVGSGGNE